MDDVKTEKLRFTGFLKKKKKAKECNYWTNVGQTSFSKEQSCASVLNEGWAKQIKGCADRDNIGKTNSIIHFPNFKFGGPNFMLFEKAKLHF